MSYLVVCPVDAEGAMRMVGHVFALAEGEGRGRGRRERKNWWLYWARVLNTRRVRVFNSVGLASSSPSPSAIPRNVLHPTQGPSSSAYLLCRSNNKSTTLRIFWLKNTLLSPSCPK